MADLMKAGRTYPGEAQRMPPASRPDSTPPSPEHTRLLGIYRRFIDAARSEGAATEGLDLVRMPAGAETEEQRVKLFVDLAEASNEENRRYAADVYRAVLGHRHPGQGLLEAGNIMIKLMKYLGPCAKQDRAIEVFAELQQGKRPVDDEMLKAFGMKLVASGSVDDALRAAQGAHSIAESGAQIIDTSDDIVVIGGVTLKVKGSEEPEKKETPAEPPEAVAFEKPPAPQKPVEFPPMTREEISGQFLGAALAGVINPQSDFELIYERLSKPHPRFSSQARAAALRDLIPIFTTGVRYLEVRDMVALADRIEKRPANDKEFAWLVRSYIAIITERHGPYGTDAEGPKGPYISTPKEMFEDLVRQQGGGEFAVLLMTTTRPKVRQWLAEKLVESGDLSPAHSAKEQARETRAALLRRLEDETGSIAAGADAKNLISISVGPETENERLSLFLEIAGVTGGELAGRHYRAILMHRRPEQGLLEAGRSYLDLLKSLSASNQQKRAAEVFAAMQKAPKESAELLRKKLARGGPVDDALSTGR